MSQSHFTLSFPLKEPSDAKALADPLATMMPALFKAEDSIGTIHYSRFTVLSERTLLFLGDFDGDFGPLLTELAKRPDRCSTSSSSTSTIRRPPQSPTTWRLSSNGPPRIWSTR